MDIVIYPNQVLRRRPSPVTVVDEEVVQQLAEMEDLMLREYGLGLSAPQVGISKQMMVVDRSEGKGRPDVVKLINPVVEYESDALALGEEGCLSFPGITLEVKRPVEVHIKGLNEIGEELVIEAKHLFARILHHEADHLVGRLFIDRVSLFIKRRIETKMKKLVRRVKKEQRLRRKVENTK